MVNLCVSVDENTYQEFRNMCLKQSRVFRIGLDFIKMGSYTFVENLQKQIDELREENEKLKKQLKFFKAIIEEKNNDLYEILKKSEISITKEDLVKLISFYEKVFNVKLTNISELENLFNIKIKLARK
ncbi:MAG: hypothetical protein QXG18_02725 [Candidatus Pacearchaeota archaeon]